MKTMLKPLALLTALGLATTPLLASEDDGRRGDIDRGAVTEKLEADGYAVRKIEMEDGLIEVYATREGTRYELYLDRNLEIVKSERK